MSMAALAAFAVSFACVRILVSRFGRVALDRPNERSLHATPVPRTGGFAVLAGAATSLTLGAMHLWVAVAVALALAALSFADDLYGLPTVARLCAHLFAAGVLSWYVLSPMNLLQLALIALAVAWITNLYNFMDGSDGLAGGMSVIGFAAYAIAASSAGEYALSVSSTALSAASAAFLLHNFHPARIFLGDVGSIPLGFLVGAVGLIGWRNDAWPLWFPLLVFGPFIGDATLTLLRRVFRGERVWRAHREHYYQRMVRMGLGHRGTALFAYAAMIVCAGAALYGRDKIASVQAVTFLSTSALLAMVALWVDMRWIRHCREAGAQA